MEPKQSNKPAVQNTNSDEFANLEAGRTTKDPSPAELSAMLEKTLQYCTSLEQQERMKADFADFAAGRIEDIAKRSPRLQNLLQYAINPEHKAKLKSDFVKDYVKYNS